MRVINVLEYDAARVKTLLTALKRGKWELSGDEILAFAQLVQWASDLDARLKYSFEHSPVVQEPQVEQPIPMDKKLTKVARKKAK